MTWRMPSETGPHDCTWMAWPSSGYALGDSAAEAERARSTWANVANAVARFEPVRMVVAPGSESVARERLSADVELITRPLNDAWMRDMGPTFVLGEGGELGAVSWIFNGWGAQSWASWDKDELIGDDVAQLAGAELISSPMVNEGGGIHVDGEGTVLVTETVQLDSGRNPAWTKDDVEAELARTIGARHVVWLPRGLTRDGYEFGTRGHVDIVAAIPSPGTVLLHDQRDPAHPDHDISAQIRETLQGSTDSAGRSWNIVDLPAPATLTDDEGPVDYSYVNHLVVNGGVIACAFDDAHDPAAVEILESVYPGREVVSVDARELYARGGGIHCITQQQPATAPRRG